MLKPKLDKICVFKIREELSNSVVRKQPRFITGKGKEDPDREGTVSGASVAMGYHEHLLEHLHVLAKPSAGKGMEPCDICALLGSAKWKTISGLLPS